MADSERSDLDEMQAVLRGMGLPNEVDVLQKFLEERVTPQVVPCLTDEQLVGLGVTTIGDRATLRQKCQRFSSKAVHGTVKAELQSVMRPLGASRAYSGYDSRATIPRRGKGKHRAPSSAAPKSKRMNTFKNVNVFRYMGSNAPREFSRSEKDIVCTFFYELNASSNGEEVMEDIIRLAKQANVVGYDFSNLDTHDVEYVKCTGKVCRVPQTESGFQWSSEAIRTLTGHGDLYIRLRKSFDDDTSPAQHTQSARRQCSRRPVSIRDSTPKSSSSGRSHPPVVLSGVDGPSTSTLLSPHSSDPFRPLLPQIDLTQHVFQPPHHERDSSNDEDFPSTFVDKPQETHLLTKEQLFEIFSSNEEGVDKILCSCKGDTMDAFKVLLGGPEVRTILQLKRKNYFSGCTKKLTISDEGDVLEEALVHYKHPAFDPLSPIRISFRDQPAIDTGGLTRQFFTNVLRKIGQEGALQLFVGSSNRLRLAYSPQVLPIMKILGTLIGHSLLHEGPGFPYLAPFVYWYLATGSEERALSYVSIPADLSGLAATVVSGLLDAESEVVFNQIVEFPTFIHLMESSGCRRIPHFTNKAAIAQDFILHDTLLRGKSALEQISSGLSDVGLLKLIRLFPIEFEPLFTDLSVDRITATTVLQLFKFPAEMNDREQVIAGMLREFILSCREEDLCRLLRYVTGSERLPPAGYAAGLITVLLIDTDAIIGATCSLMLTLPIHFESYDSFSQCLKAVLPAGKKSFNMI